MAIIAALEIVRLNWEREAARWFRGQPTLNSVAKIGRGRGQEDPLNESKPHTRAESELLPPGDRSAWRAQPIRVILPV